MERLNDLSDDELLNLGRNVANAMIDLMIASKNKNYKDENLYMRLTEVEVNSEKSFWMQFQINAQSNPMLFINDEICTGYIPLHRKKEISFEIFDGSCDKLEVS